MVMPICPEQPEQRCWSNKVGRCLCKGCETVPAVPLVPPAWVDVPVVGWTDGANADSWLVGDCAAKWKLRVEHAIAVGFVSTRWVPGTVRDMWAGWWVERGGGHIIATPHINGPYSDYVVNVDSETEFGMRRVGGVISMYLDSNLIVSAQSNRRGAVSLGAALYSSGDRVI